MRLFLEELHKDIGVVAGEVCIAITIYRVPGGIKAMERWVENLRAAADKIEAHCEEIKTRHAALGR